MSATLRIATSADADAAGVICHDAFKTIAERHAFPPDFPDAQTAVGLMKYLLSRDDVFGVAAERDGRLVGSNFLWKDEVAGVGPITIDPRAQNEQIGRRLMEAVLRHAAERGLERVRLVQAAYHGRSLALYTRLGFDPREPLSVINGAPLNLRFGERPIRPATLADLEAASGLCRRAHGFARSVEFRSALDERAAFVVEHDGRITGYTTGVGFLGHSVGETNDDLKALIGAAPAFPGPGFFVPTRNAGLLRWCLEQGLRIVQPMTLMTIGPYEEPKGAWLPSVLY